MEQEIWKTIDWLKTSIDYEVSNLGNVRALYSVNYHKIPFVCKDGFLKVQLQVKNYKNNRCSYGVHNLVARAFMPEFSSRKAIKFLDDDKTNCKIYNLALKHPSPLRDEAQLKYIRERRARKRLYKATIQQYSTTSK